MTKFFNLLLLLVLIATAPTQVCSTSNDDLDQLVLEVYVSEQGETLVVGYLDSEDLDDLPLLEGSEYIYDGDSMELYLLTNSLTSKNDGCWMLELAAESHWREYLVIFYFPLEAELDKVNLSEGLEYGLTRSDDSLVAEVWGCEVESPNIIIDYGFVSD